MSSDARWRELLEGAQTQTGTNLAALSQAAPVLVVFLRHFGCTFCRQALADIAAQRQAIEATGTQLAFVHMSSETEAAALFAQYGLPDALRISDPQRGLYRAFDLGRGRLAQVFGLRVLWRAFESIVFDGFGLGRLAGDGLQMPGVFVLQRGEVLRSFRHLNIADRPDYAALACRPE